MNITILIGEIALEEKNNVTQEKFLDSVEKYWSKELSLQEFVNLNKDTILYSSTPYGNDKNGNPKQWVLGSPITHNHLLPTFSSVEEANKMFMSLGRGAFIIVQSTLKELLNTLDSSEQMKGLGLVIDPQNGIKGIEIPPHIRVEE